MQFTQKFEHHYKEINQGVKCYSKNIIILDWSSVLMKIKSWITFISKKKEKKYINLCVHMCIVVNWKVILQQTKS